MGKSVADRGKSFLNAEVAELKTRSKRRGICASVSLLRILRCSFRTVSSNDFEAFQLFSAEQLVGGGIAWERFAFWIPENRATDFHRDIAEVAG